MKRRRVLTGTVVAVLGLSGCSILSSSSGEISVAIFNQTDIEYSIEIQIFQDQSGPSQSDARVYRGMIDVPSQEMKEENKIADNNKSIIKYKVYNNNRWIDEGHIHRYPKKPRKNEVISLYIKKDGNIKMR